MVKSKQINIFCYRSLVDLILIFCHVAYPVRILSSVFESKNHNSEVFTPDMTTYKQGLLSARVNGSPLKIESYISEKTADDSMQYYADYADRQGYKLINSPQIAEVAKALINMGMHFAPDKWYYLFYSKTNGDMTMITVGEFENNTRIVIVNISKMQVHNNEVDYTTDIKHYPTFEKVLCVEILSGLSVISSANFYKSEGANLQTIRTYYKDYLTKHNWIIQKQYANAKNDIYWIEKKGKSYMLSIVPMENNEKWLLVLGNE